MMKLLVVLLAVSLAQGQSYLNWVSREQPDSREHGTRPGTRTTNCACGWANKGRIVGGKVARANEYPWMAVLYDVRNRMTFCGGSIVTKRHILTAAHCTSPKKSQPLAVILGLHDQTSGSENYRQVVNVRQTIEHRNYNNRGGHEFDIALMVLEKDMEFNLYVGPVCLPHAQLSAASLENSYLKVMGWGRLATNGKSASQLMKVNIRVIPLRECASRYRSFIDLANPNQICTFSKNKDSCQGDSGGPLVILDSETNRYTQRALVSYGKACASIDPAVNTDVAHHIQWIKQNIAQTGGHQVCAKI